MFDRVADRTLSALPEAWTMRLRRLSDRLISLRQLIALIGLVFVCIFAGLLSAYLGDLVAARPVFFLGLPLLLAVGFTLLISPKALIVAIILLRAGANPIFDNARLGNLGGLGGIVNLAVIMLAMILVIQAPRRIPKLAWLAWLPFIGFQMVGIGYSPEGMEQVRPWLAQVSTGAMFLIAFHLVDDFSSLVKLFRLILVSSIPVVVLCVLDRAGIYGAPVPGMEDMDVNFDRLRGPFAHANILAFYLLNLIGVLFYLWKQEIQRAGPAFRAFAVFYLFVLLGLLGATQTRSAWIGAAALFFLYGIFFERRYLIYMVILPALAIAFVPEVRDRILDLGKGNEVVQYAQLNSFAWRKLLWEQGLDWMAPTRYLAGYGLGAFRFLAPQFFTMAGGINWGAHSVFVQVFFELGAIGLAAFLWTFACCAKLIAPEFRVNRLLALIFTALLVCQVLVSLSDNMLDYLVSNWYFWLTIGAVCALAGRAKEETPSTTAGVGEARS